MVFACVVAFVMLSLVSAVPDNNVDLNRFLAESFTKRSGDLMETDMDEMASDLTKKRSSQYTDILNQIDIIRNRRGTGECMPRIGFTVRFRVPKLRSAGILKFDHIFTNHGNGYNAATGKFTCNTSGLYIFNFSILSKTKYAMAYIMKNNKQLTLAYTSGNNGGKTASGSASAVVELKVGDEIWVKSLGSYYYINNSHFSGALVAA